MHQKLFVAFNKENAENSTEARNHVYSTLVDDPSFVGEGGRFSSPIADWFVIGGRWSGELSRATFMKKVNEQIEKWEKEKDVQILGTSYGSNEKSKIQAELKKKVEKYYQDSLPEEWKNKGLVYDRDTYSDDGFEDDAVILTKELYDVFLKDYAENEGEYIHQDGAVFYEETWGGRDLVFIDLDYGYDEDSDELNPKMIGKKWLVVVDYHS